MTAAFRHVTVPVDGSLGAERGVAFALELVRSDGTVTFCGVVDPVPMPGWLHDDAQLLCERARSRAAQRGIRADLRVLYGRRDAAIEAFVRGSASDAIVIGMHGGSGAGRTLTDAVTEDLMRRSDVPVVVVHEGDPVRTGPIVVAIDFSPAAATALDAAIRVAAVRSMQLVLIHVSEPESAGCAPADAVLHDAGERARAMKSFRLRSLTRLSWTATISTAAWTCWRACARAPATRIRSRLPS